MKKKSFGNVVNETVLTISNNLNDDRFKNNGIEFLAPDDRQAARDINRPIRQLYEDVENNYDILQTVSKIVLGDKKVGIVPDVLEEFNVENLVVDSFYHGNQPFLRIPTGALVINNLFERNEGNIPSFKRLNPKYSQEEVDDFKTNNYVIRDNNSAFVVNKPRVELFERELANHYNIDLAEQDNDISINYTTEDSKKGKYLKYDCYVTRTIVSEGLLTTKKIHVTVSPQDTNKVFNNVFEIVNRFYQTVNNYANKDGFYSLEETIPLKNVSSGKLMPDGNYTLFFKAGDSNENSVYSLSGNYGIALSSNQLLDSDIKLFTFDLKDGKISNKKCLVSKINRAELDIKNLNISNNYITVDEVAWHLCKDPDVANMI